MCNSLPTVGNNRRWLICHIRGTYYIPDDRGKDFTCVYTEHYEAGHDGSASDEGKSSSQLQPDIYKTYTVSFLLTHS